MRALVFLTSAIFLRRSFIRATGSRVVLGPNQFAQGEI